MYNPFSLDKKVILITGASSGIGRATAIECAKMGARVIITGRNEQRLYETYALLEGENHQYITADLGNRKELEAFVTQLPTLHGIVHSAGISILKPVKMIKPESFDALMVVNLYAPIYITQQLIASKKIEKSASIVFISSIGRKCVANGSAMYAASKGAITSFAKVLALELSPRNIRVNCIEPGVIETHIFDDGIIADEQLALDMKNYPLGRFGRAEEIAHAAVYLLSDAASWTTGSSLVVDGGLTLK